MIPRKSKVAKSGKTQWQLDFGRDIAGKRKRLYFDTEKEADKEISQLAVFGSSLRAPKRRLTFDP